MVTEAMLILPTLITSHVRLGGNWISFECPTKTFQNYRVMLRTPTKTYRYHKANIADTLQCVHAASVAASFAWEEEAYGLPCAYRPTSFCILAARAALRPSHGLQDDAAWRMAGIKNL